MNFKMTQFTDQAFNQVVALIDLVKEALLKVQAEYKKLFGEALEGIKSLGRRVMLLETDRTELKVELASSKDGLTTLK